MIHYFNPGHESALLNASKYYMAPANVAKMQQELSYLAAWYAHSNDYIFVHQKPSEEFIEKVVKQFDLPHYILREDFLFQKEKLKNEEICFWGISPQAIHLFETINTAFELNLAIPAYSDIYRDICNRNFSKKCLEYILNIDKTISKELLPEFYFSLEDIEIQVKKSPIQFLAKAPYSSSGRGLLWLPVGELTQTEKQILHGIIKKQKSVSIEKALDKKLDFALEFYMENRNIQFEGVSLFNTNSKGGYVSNYLGTQQSIIEILSEYIQVDKLWKIKDILICFLSQNIPSSYKGYIGVDMMIYKEVSQYKLHPCVEINVRNNMGVVAAKISKNFLQENSYGKFHIDFSPKEGEIFSEHKSMKNKYPLVLERKKIKSGYLSLCPVSEKNKYRAYILIESKN